ncbi:MAG: N-acetylmuramoyl-L-alanine amidase [Thermoguttaceae bacterium]|nr:N-acetylmuramoyl-L-alanine amidase [Thermoguttaceae bacterium]
MKKWISVMLVGLCFIAFNPMVRGQDSQPSTSTADQPKEKQAPLPKFEKNKVSVYLSPSTQEKNMGAGEFNTEEQRMNEITDVVEKILKEQGVIVYRNRPEMTLQELVEESNQRHVDLHFAIHSNAFNQEVRGTECYCYRFGGAGERLAKKVMEQICSIYDGPRRGVKESADHFGKGKPLYETANTTAPTALVEIAFHDQPDDAQWILSNEKLIGEKLATALLLHLAEERPECVR